MKHKHGNRILGRSRHHRRALLRSLSGELLEHGSIITTQAKAKEVRRFIEPLITSAKQDITLALRRSWLRQGVNKHQIGRLKNIAGVHAGRRGGYTRLTTLPPTRADGATLSRIDIIDFDPAE